MTDERSITVAEQFGRNLLLCRRRQAMSQDEVSWCASLHRTQISQLERGLHVPGIDTLVKLAGALEVGSDELLDGIAWTPGSLQRGRLLIPSTQDSAAIERVGDE